MVRSHPGPTNLFMKVLYTLLADHAFLSIDKKVNIIGVFETINTTNFPVTHPRFVVVGAIQPTKTEFKIALDIVDPQGDSILGQLQEREVKLPENTHNQNFNFIIEIINTTFKNIGQYKVELLIDKKKITEVPLRVAETTSVRAS